MKPTRPGVDPQFETAEEYAVYMVRESHRVYVEAAQAALAAKCDRQRQFDLARKVIRLHGIADALGMTRADVEAIVDDPAR
jgi:hypothetical protein